jgi:hypothetical protein
VFCFARDKIKVIEIFSLSLRIETATFYHITRSKIHRMQEKNNQEFQDVRNFVNSHFPDCRE